MKEFLKTNTITYNLMSFTAFKSILLFSLLAEGPKSYKEIQEFMEKHEYLHESVSIDALRIYINSLREIGCTVDKKTSNGITRYSISSHPLLLKFDEKQIESIIKIYSAITKNIEITDLITLQNFFIKISEHIENEDLKLQLQNLSPISNIDPELITELLKHVKNNAEITVFYNSKTTKKKNITILVDKLYIRNGKLYISGLNSEHKNYSSFLVDKIMKIVSVNLKEKTITIPNFIVGYQYKKDKNENFELLENEKLISSENNILTIEITSKNKFEITQRIMSHSVKCKVLYPKNYKEYIISTLKKMKEGYIEK